MQIGGCQLTKPLSGAQHFPQCKGAQDFLHPFAMIPNKNKYNTLAYVIGSLAKIAFNSMIRWTQGGYEFITCNNLLKAKSVSGWSTSIPVLLT